jgi:predicted ribosomally synthesized peptide with SipW-like signal peptide
MKSIITSLGMIVFVAAIVVGGTGAFFSDTETSTGNVFTAGAIDLKVDSQAHYNNMVCVLNTQSPAEGDYWWQPEADFVAGPGHYPVPGSECWQSWTLTDLGPSYKFFDYGDVKPGDSGENTISLHIDSNPAWVCADVEVTKNDDMSCVDPENDAEGTGVCGNSIPTAAFDGELAQNVTFAAWLDHGNVAGWQNTATVTVDTGEGDNIWQAATEPLLFSNETGPASDVLNGKSYALAAPNVNGGVPMTPLVTNYIGLAWCAGTQTVGDTTITCDGSTMGNEAQTDQMTADITFRVEQARNNPNFRCVFPEDDDEEGGIVVGPQ